MTIWTVHHPDPGMDAGAYSHGDWPCVVPEQFSLAAALLGPVWLAARRAWIPAFLLLAGWVVLAALPFFPLRGAFCLALLAAQGLFANDLRRWALGLHGYRLVCVVAAPDADTALSKALARGYGPAGAYASQIQGREAWKQAS